MRYDAIVIGAGSAGAVVAARLSEDPNRSVLLLEAGPDYPDFKKLPDDLKYGWGTGADVVGIDERHDWRFTGRATELHPSIPVHRGKVTGGTSAINGQVFLRGIPDDFDYWVSMGNTEWGFEKVLPYFRKIETDLDFHDDFHGTDGPIIVRRHKLDSLLTEQLAFYQACLDAGFPPSPDHNHPDATGVGPYPLNNPDGIRWSTAIGYLDPARHRLNLTVRPNCLAHRILFDGNRAVGVEVESGGEMFRVYGDEVIVSAGAIGSPQLLMLSGLGPASHLRILDIPVVRDLPGVGRNLRDHPTLDVTWRAKEDFPMPPGDVGPQKVTLRYTAPGSRLKNDMITVMRFWPPQRMLKMSVAIYLAAGAGWLELQSRDPHAQPTLNYNFLEEPFDRQRMRDGVHLCLKLTEHRAFKEIVEARNEPLEADLESDDALDRWILRNVTTMGHISCTCKMGPASDPMAVVDQHGKVHGIEGLRVADASIMPDCVRANTNATTIMIGERIADFIKQGIR